MNKTFINIITLVFAFTMIHAIELFGGYDSAYVNIDYDKEYRKPISPYLTGGFIEYYFSFANGPLGLYAQEFVNRGFDIHNNEMGISAGWFSWYDNANTKVVLKTPEGGFNTNGLHYQRITKENNTGNAGIYQRIFVTPDKGFDFYIYMKGDSSVGDVKLRIMNKSFSRVLYETSLGKPGKEWKKVTAVTPKFNEEKMVNVIICFSSSGTLDLDEASLMPSGNINGIREEYDQFYNEWKPPILRYPGGWFVEYSGYRWDMGIGDIDRRKIFEDKENVRMDFGLDEFLRFCEHYKIEPHITINFLTGNPDEAASIVEYCNGATGTPYGSMRAANGHPEPYNVKYWEIGNEIWTYPVNYATGFVKFYDSMKEADPSISCLISADIWQWRPFFDTLMTIVGPKCEIYGWHWTQPITPKNCKASDEEIYLSAVGGSQQIESHIDSVDAWIAEKGRQGVLSQGITEIWSTYNTEVCEWTLDTVPRSASLESGLWMASQLISIMKKSPSVSIVEKTNAVSTYQTVIDYDKGTREFYETPSYYAFKMIANHPATELLKTNVVCRTYTQKNIDGLFDITDAPWLHTIAASTRDSVFIYTVNRHPYDTIVANFNIRFLHGKATANVYELNSENYLDANCLKDPKKIVVREKNCEFINSYNYPPHSFTIIALPWDQIDSVEGPDNYYQYIVFPNPFGNSFRVKLPVDIETPIVNLYNIMGRRIPDIEYENINNVLLFRTECLSQGMYYLEIITNNYKKVIPVLKQYSN